MGTLPSQRRGHLGWGSSRGGIPDKEKGTALAQKHDVAWDVCVAKAGVRE